MEGSSATGHFGAAMISLTCKNLVGTEFVLEVHANEPVLKVKDLIAAKMKVNNNFYIDMYSGCDRMEDHLTLGDYSIPIVGHLMLPNTKIKQVMFNITQLPCGWVRQRTEETVEGKNDGQAYYVNPQEQITQWNNPAFDNFKKPQKKEYNRWELPEWDGT